MLLIPAYGRQRLEAICEFKVTRLRKAKKKQNKTKKQIMRWVDSKDGNLCISTLKEILRNLKSKENITSSQFYQFQGYIQETSSSFPEEGTLGLVAKKIGKWLRDKCIDKRSEFTFFSVDFCAWCHRHMTVFSDKGRPCQIGCHKIKNPGSQDLLIRLLSSIQQIILFYASLKSK